jgi:CheY-like chemotaxis protein
LGAVLMSLTLANDGSPTADTTRRILIVEDSAAMARCLAGIAKSFGSVTVEATVSGALEQLAGHSTWIAFIVDLGLPDGSGLDVVSVIRARDRNVPALILTGDNGHDAINATFDLRAQYLVKPATHAQIERFLCAVKERRNATPAPPSPSPKLPADLEKVVSGALHVGADLGALEAEHAYHLALVARAATGRRVGGRSAVAICAEALGMARPTLQAYVSLIARWSAIDIKRLLGRRDCNGRSVITVSQLMLIARAPGAQRAFLLEQAARGDVDIRCLRSLVRECSTNEVSWREQLRLLDGPAMSE